MESATAPVRRPPGPSAPHSLGVDAATLEYLAELGKDYGNIAYVTTPRGRHAYFVNDPAAIHRVLVRDRDSYDKGPGFELVKLLLGNGIFVSDGAHWRRARTMIQPGFTRKHLNQLIGLITASCEDRAGRWEMLADAGDPIDVTFEMTDFALELILRAIFGPDYEARVIADGENPFAFLSEETARDLELVVRFRQLRKLVMEIVERRRQTKEEGDTDFLSIYIDARDKAGAAFTDRDLLDELMTLIVAGFETSAGTLNWAWYLVAKHAGIQQKIAAEADRVLGSGGAIDKDSVAELTYLKQVLNETMRLYPPGWIFSRRANADLSLGDYDVPAGTDIYISPYLLHRTPEFWPDPDTFDPDRFAKDRLTAENQAAFIPFSLGPRRCIGEHFAMLEMRIHLALLAQRFQMRLTTDESPTLEVGVNLRSSGSILLRAEKRGPKAP